MIKKILKKTPLLSLCALLLVFAGCDANRVIINSVDEREANEIVVLLASKGIKADKTVHATSGAGAADSTMKFDIAVGDKEATSAMAFLNQNGLPRIQSTNLLTLFAKQGLMSSQQEENIRYQAGLAEQIAGTIRQIDGIIDAQVQIAFPPTDNNTMPGAGPPLRTTAAVYVKHQGVLDDVNSHLVTKIKRLVSSSVSGLEINDVTVIADRARFLDINLMNSPEALTAGSMAGEYVSIWSIVMSKESAARFRFLFFSLIVGCILFAAALVWMLWKFYPLLRHKGSLKELLGTEPFSANEKKPEEPSSEEQGY